MIKRFLLLAVATMAISSATSAAQITYTAATTPNVDGIADMTLPVAGAILFPQWDPGDFDPTADLNQVQLTFLPRLVGSLTLTNTGLTAGSASGFAQALFNIQGIGPVFVQYTTPTADLGAGASQVFTFDHAPASVVGPFAATGTWIGIGDVARTVSSGNLSFGATIEGTGSFQANGSVQGGASGKVTYTYDSAVPEPGAYAMIGGGLVFLGFFRRRA